MHNMSYSHSYNDIEYTLRAYEEVLTMLKDAVQAGDVKSRIKGIPVQPTFRKTSDFNGKPLITVR
jgi:glutamate-1-semialdehyde 2,1-aminomutase